MRVPYPWGSRLLVLHPVELVRHPLCEKHARPEPAPGRRHCEVADGLQRRLELFPTLPALPLVTRGPLAEDFEADSPRRKQEAHDHHPVALLHPREETAPTRGVPSQAGWPWVSRTVRPLTPRAAYVTLASLS